MLNACGVLDENDHVKISSRSWVDLVVIYPTKLVSSKSEFPCGSTCVSGSAGFRVLILSV